jgi:hypothetical protein
MTEAAGRPSYMGARIPRIEDDRLLTGRGRCALYLAVGG